MSEPAKSRPATLADWLAIPEEHRRHELVDGVIVQKEGASGRHGGAQLKLGAHLDPYHRKPGGHGPGGWVFAAETDIVFEDTQVFLPDLSGWRRERMPVLPREVPISIRPDWVCEILSPRNKRHDLISKKRVYQRHGVPHYWIVDPMEETLAVHRWHADGYVEVLIADRTERVRAEPFGEIELRVGILFGDDNDT
jgi:Uma2 family endonuclease